MKKAVIFTATAAVVASSAAFADVAGVFQSDIRYYEGDGNTITDLDGAAYAVIDLYVDFSATNTEGFNNENSFLLNMFGGNMTANNWDGTFNQADLASALGGTWQPNLSLAAGTANPLIDSFVTIGGGVGDQAPLNQTALDPAFGDGTNDTIYNENIGWYAAPTANQGFVDINLQAWVGQFCVTGDAARAGANFDLTISVGYNYGEGTGAFFANDLSGNYTFVPAPGAFALLGLSGLCVRRRRA